MRIDTSGLDPFAPFTSASGDVCGDVLSVPSFELPRTTDVSLFDARTLEFLFLIVRTYVFFLSLFSLMDSRRSQFRW